MKGEHNPEARGGPSASADDRLKRQELWENTQKILMLSRLEQRETQTGDNEYRGLRDF